MFLKIMFNSLFNFLKTISQRLSVRLRLTVLYFLTFGTSMVIFGVILFNFLASTVQQEFDDTLYNYAVDVSETVILDPAGDLSINTPKVDREKIFPFSLGTSLIQIRHISGKILTQVGAFGGFDIPYQEDFKKLTSSEESVYRTIQRLDEPQNAESEFYRVVSFPLDNSPAPQLILQVAAPLTFVEAKLERRKQLLEIGIPVLLILATLISFFISSRAFAPVIQIIQTAQEVGPGVFSKRIPIGPAKDEIQKLAMTMNEMLDRIEKSFQSQERFVADASHQLLTPLSICKAEIEQALKNLNSSSLNQIKQALESSHEELDHLTHLVKDLLLLARIDAGVDALSMLPINFPDILIEAVERAEKLARDKLVRIKVNFLLPNPDEINILGDEDLMKNLIFNLLENAVKYSSSGNVVAIEVYDKTSSILLNVIDEGPGLPASGYEHLFERFSRGLNTKGQPGYGLGLAIAKKISDLHKAELSATNRPDSKGAVFHFEIKKN